MVHIPHVDRELAIEPRRLNVCNEAADCRAVDYHRVGAEGIEWRTAITGRNGSASVFWLNLNQQKCKRAACNCGESHRIHHAEISAPHYCFCHITYAHNRATSAIASSLSHAVRYGVHRTTPDFLHVPGHPPGVEVDPVPQQELG